MGIIAWGDIRRGTLAIVFVIVPTVLLGMYLAPALQSYQITGPGLWELKRKQVPDAVIKPLHVLRLKRYFFKFKLMSEVEFRISDPALYKKYKKKIESQISVVPVPAYEYIYLAALAAYYGVLWFGASKWFPDGKI